MKTVRFVLPRFPPFSLPARKRKECTHRFPSGWRRHRLEHRQALVGPGMKRNGVRKRGKRKLRETTEKGELGIKRAEARVEAKGQEN